MSKTTVTPKGTAQKAETLIAAIEREFPYEDKLMKRSDLRPWEELQRMMPKTPADVLHALALDIKSHGMHDRLKVLPDGRIFDGMTRYSLTRDMPLYATELPVRVYDVPEEVAEDMAFALNFDRRPIDAEMRAKVLHRTLKAHPGWTDRRIAERCGVSPTTVGTTRRKMEELGEITTPEVQEGKGGKKAQKATKATRQKAAAKTSVKKATKAGGKSRPTAPKTIDLLGFSSVSRMLVKGRPTDELVEAVQTGKVKPEHMPKKMEARHWDAIEKWHQFLAALVTLDPRNAPATNGAPAKKVTTKKAKAAK